MVGLKDSNTINMDAISLKKKKNNERKLKQVFVFKKGDDYTWMGVKQASQTH